MVSKLNPIAFHTVNSPVEAPVIRRRPSGVQMSLFIWHFRLLVAVRTKRVVTELATQWGVAFGGSNCQ